MMISRRTLHDASGAEIAEAALVLPIFFMILLGIYWFGMAFNTYATINRAAMAGARVAVANSCASCTNSPPSTATVANAVTSVMQASNVNTSSTTIIPYTPSSTACPNTTIACSNSGNINVCSNVQVQSATPAGGGNAACGVSVSFQYPYQFFLPFTSLNMQQITLTASAQMKQEN
jgi:Flp pilus assembly protein TadG